MSWGSAVTIVLNVVIGIIQNEQDQYLLGLRPQGKPLAGFWEFPGGKIEAMETSYEALCRELEEELAIEVLSAELLFEYVYETQKNIFFSVWQVRQYYGEPKPLAADELRWVDKPQLAQHIFPPPNRRILQQLGVVLCDC
ncbi:MAG: mutT [Gammaproteobacteria bacterium]|jgi:8-oxo-dGTP diphosphatase|nr:mutT [Gammaproteobacteria bacterium]